MLASSYFSKRPLTRWGQDEHLHVPVPADSARSKQLVKRLPVLRYAWLDCNLLLTSPQIILHFISSQCERTWGSFIRNGNSCNLRTHDCSLRRRIVIDAERQV